MGLVRISIFAAFTTWLVLSSVFAEPESRATGPCAKLLIQSAKHPGRMLHTTLEEILTNPQSEERRQKLAQVHWSDLTETDRLSLLHFAADSVGTKNRLENAKFAAESNDIRWIPILESYVIDWRSRPGAFNYEAAEVVSIIYEIMRQIPGTIADSFRGRPISFVYKDTGTEVRIHSQNYSRDANDILVVPFAEKDARRSLPSPIVNQVDFGEYSTGEDRDAGRVGLGGVFRIPAHQYNDLSHRTVPLDFQTKFYKDILGLVVLKPIADKSAEMAVLKSAISRGLYLVADDSLRPTVRFFPMRQENPLNFLPYHTARNQLMAIADFAVAEKGISRIDVFPRGVQDVIFYLNAAREIFGNEQEAGNGKFLADEPLRWLNSEGKLWQIPKFDLKALPEKMKEP